MSDLLTHFRQARIDALRNGSLGKPGFAEHGSKALDFSDQTDRQRQTAAVFGSPPVFESVSVEDDEPSLFGSLYADIPLALRQAALKRQRDALEARLGTSSDNAALQPIKDLQQTLETAEQAADNAATALLGRSQPFDLLTLNREFTALHQAHKAGLLAETDLQKLLEQISSEEHQLIKALLDPPDNPDSDCVAASLILSTSETADSPTTETLNGPFVMTRAGTLLDLTSTHSLLLYWPGTGGGLQRFASRRALESQMFALAEKDPLLTLQLKKISGDPLHHALDQVTSEYEEQAAVLRAHPGKSMLTPERSGPMQALRERFRAALQVPVHAARNLAFAHLLEQNRSGRLADNLPHWQRNLPASERSNLKTQIQAYIAAMHRSHQLLMRALPPRDDFTRQHLHQRLREDFSVQGPFSVQIDLPDSARLQKQLSDGSTMTTPQKLVAVPSASRSKVPLEDLAQSNIDNTPSMRLESESLRLLFMTVEVIAADDSARAALRTGITHEYLRKILPELDLPKTYEQTIRDAFMGGLGESAFVREHRRECLIEPWRLMLKMQGECARLQQRINHHEWQIFNIAIEADTTHAWNTGALRIVLLPAFLRAGGKDTPNQGPVTLSGVTFIQEQISGTTLLYLPDSPDDQVLRRYDSLEEARKALFKLCEQDPWISYLAGRALQGDVRAHENRLAQAIVKKHDAMIGVGMPWPSTTSLAAHLLNAHMGRLIEAHRGTSRANDALYMERYALKGPRAFNYLKMALGLLPFVGVAFAVYDAWTSANQAVAAFLRGDVGDGLAELESVLLSLIDAAMDLLPGEMTTSALSRAARSLTRTRQLRRLAQGAGALHVPSQRQARHLTARFAGYEYEKPISLSGLEPATEGLYRGIYRHADGDFILRQGRIFEVQRSNNADNWRLHGTSTKTYKQPIALDETGQWDTWFGVHGTAVEGGTLGGGNIAGHLADAADPFWPQAIRQRLPRWLVDRKYRRYRQLTQAADSLADQLDARGVASDAAINRYGAASQADRPALMPASEAACVGDIQLATRHYETLDDLMPLTKGNKKRALLEIQSKEASLLTDRYWRRAYHLSHSTARVTEKIDDLALALDNLPPESLAQRISLLEDIRTQRVDYVRLLEQMEQLKGDANYWYERIRIRAHKEPRTAMIEDINTKHSDANLLYLKTSQRLETVKRYGRTDDVSWFYLMGQARELRSNVDRALYTQYNLPNIQATRAQRNQILHNCLELYTRYRREMNIWTATYPQHFHLNEVPALMSGIEWLAERARKGIIEPPAPTTGGQAAQRVFTTADNQLMYGIERWEPTTQKHQYVSTGRAGHEEVWEQGSDGSYRLLNPRNTEPSAPAPMSLAKLVADAQRRLDAQAGYQIRVESYAEQDMLPVDLEHMMVSEAAELNRRADRIETLAAQNPIIPQLRDKASELTLIGRNLRTRQSLTSQKPTDGMLEDLIEQNAVEIRKTSALKNLGKRHGHNDYLQEYEIWDMTLSPAELLWYAHFHYRKPTAAFGNFEKAHLKLPDHRFLTHADDATLPYAGIGKKSAVLEHFEAIAANDPV
ncbi:dermonecrotic toxin domain-containing protein [Pseudomonas sp. NPDC087639]|uniref:dermonecrotic toxin domain-containing protein n=1 Tax=Pseudomonas sp. NPDC087639 TaxID=3364445 RepID=UPI0038248700